MIPQETIDRILDTAVIEDVVKEFVPLKKKGKNYVACCPFHSENTPSFTVFPHYGIFKCFGCHEKGNVVGFLMKHQNMTFPEALHWLAEKYGIKIEEQVPTAQEQTLHAQKESAWSCNEYLAKQYAQELFKPENTKALEYVRNRWGEEYARDIGIGFCPKWSKSIEEAPFRAEVTDLLDAQMKGGYDLMMDRITIPIVDRYNHVIGFTSRSMDPEAKSKYMNSRSSIIYDKQHTLFGIDRAWNEARKTGLCYVVEGAPDVMRLQIIGVPNAVATLGTELAEGHLALLHRIATSLCFLPDADPPKEGQQFGPGISAVMKSGELALKHGFKVSVKQIPLTDEKMDPDTYCTTINAFAGIDEQDYIEWMARLLFLPNMTTDQRSNVVDRMVHLLAYIDNDTTVDMYITKLVKFGVGKRVWEKALNKCRNDRVIEEKKLQQEKESDLFRRYGFNVEHNHYFSLTEKGTEYIWSNFTMKPLFHIKDAVNPKRIYFLTNEEGEEELVEMKQEDLISLARFKQRVEGLGNFMWKASDRELTKLKSYLYANTESAIEITQLGWQSRSKVYAFGNGVLHDGKFQLVDEDGIVRLKHINLYLPAHSKIFRDDPKLFQFERRFVHLGLSAVPLRQFTDQMFKVFGNNAKVAFCFFLATLFRDVVTRESRSFPILNIFGVKGSGKSELGHTLMSFFELNNIPPNIQNSTLPALNETVAAVSNALVHIDEYKNDLDINKNEFLKGLWDGTGRTRINMDLDKKKETTSVDSGIILTGQEMPTADIALFSRLIFLAYEKAEFSEKQKSEFQKLKQMRSTGLTHLTIELLKLREKVERSFPEEYRVVMNDLTDRLKDSSIEDRIQYNWQGPLAMLRCLESDLDVGISYKDMLDIVTEGIIKQNNYCKENNELSAFWKMLMFLVDEGEFINGGDFRITYTNKLKTNKVDILYSEARPILYLQKSRIFKLYKKHGKLMGEKAVSEESMLYYLEHSREYLGEKRSVRYKVYHKGALQYEQNTSGSRPKAKEIVKSSMSFDYSALAKNYPVDLEIANGEDQEEYKPPNRSAVHDSQLPFVDS